MSKHAPGTYARCLESKADQSEGDLNFSEQRAAFIEGRHDDATALLLSEDARWFLHQSLSSPCLDALGSASGSYLINLAGRRILDFHGNSVHQVGYGHPRVVEAMRRQMDELAFCPRRYTSGIAVQLARRLAELAPVGPGSTPGRVLLAPSGAAAVSTAIKLARLATGRYKTLSMYGAFHGATMDTISVGGERLFRDGLGPLMPGCLHVPPYDASPMGQQSADLVEYVLEQEGDIAAVIAEPMRWTTVVPPPASYWQRLRAACDRHGALLILDEIPACLGRTGKMFCAEHFEVRPDILVIGKGLGGGMFPLAALIAREDLNIAGHTALGHYTHEKSPLGAAAAMATLDVIEGERLIERAARLGKHMLEQLNALSEQLPVMQDVRGLGLQLAVELAAVPGLPAESMAERVLYRCLADGLSFKVSAGRVLTLTPPLNLSDDEADQAMRIIELAIREASRPA